jgi:hypothetical protein
MGDISSSPRFGLQFWTFSPILIANEEKNLRAAAFGAKHPIQTMCPNGSMAKPSLSDVLDCRAASGGRCAHHMDDALEMPLLGSFNQNSQMKTGCDENISGVRQGV